jgi:hypothetical protein
MPLLNARLALLATLDAFRREFPPAHEAVAASIPIDGLTAADVLKRLRYSEMRDRALQALLKATEAVLEDPDDEVRVLQMTAHIDRALAEMGEAAHRLAFLTN